MNENTFKERLKLFFIKNQRSSECSMRGAQAPAGRNQTLPELESRALSSWDEKPLPSAGGCVPVCPQRWLPSPGLLLPVGLSVGCWPTWFGGMRLHGEEGMLPATFAR